MILTKVKGNIRISFFINIYIILLMKFILVGPHQDPINYRFIKS